MKKLISQPQREWCELNSEWKLYKGNRARYSCFLHIKKTGMSIKLGFSNGKTYKIEQISDNFKNG